MVLNFTVSNLDCLQLTSHICYAQKGKKAPGCGGQLQEGSVHIGFCNCARTGCSVCSLIIVCFIPVQGYSTVAPSSRVSRSKKNKIEGWEKKI